MFCWCERGTKLIVFYFLQILWYGTNLNIMTKMIVKIYFPLSGRNRR